VIAATGRQVTPRPNSLAAIRVGGAFDAPPARYLVLKLPVADDRLPTPSRLSTWKKYGALRLRPVMVTEWLMTRVRSRGVVLP
jgi:hypothetical protein